MLKERIEFLKTLFINPAPEWQMAIRYQSKDKLYNKDNQTAFTLIKNPRRYWCADPFLYERNNRLWLFCEAFDRKKNKGIIAAAEVCNGKIRKFKPCIEMPMHLSYPLIFEENGELYIIPESSKANKIVKYICTTFPYKWEEKEVIMDNISACDVTIIDSANRKYLYTETSPEKGLNYYSNLSGILCDRTVLIYNDDYTVRSAGHIIKDGNRFIRPAQDCRGSYGCALFFKEIDNCDIENYEEHIILKVVAPGNKCKNSDIEIKLTANPKNRTYKGIHTYNACGNYEIIDLKYYDGKSIYSFSENLKTYLKVKFLQNSKIIGE